MIVSEIGLTLKMDFSGAENKRIDDQFRNQGFQRRKIKERYMKPMVVLCVILALALCQTALASDAAANSLPSGMNNPLPMKYPEMGNAPTPESIKEGLRATYEMTTSSPDTTAGGGLIFESGRSGAGLVQVDVVALEDGEAATWTTAFSPDPTTRAMKKVNFYGSVSPEGCGDFWCNPDVLRSISERADGDLTVDKGTYDLNGQQYEVIRFYYQSPQGFTLGMIYDLGTGFMLHHTADFSSSFATEEGAMRSRGQNCIMTLRNIRQVNIPWDDGSVPSWAVPGTVLNFQGQHAFWLPQLPDVAPTISGIHVRLAIQAVHDRFVEGRQQTYTQDPVQPAYIPMISGVAQLMGFWIPKEALSLEPGMVDYDPDTGIVVSVLQSGPDGVIMEETNSVNYKLTALYDAGGKVVQTSKESYSGTASGERDDLQHTD